MPRWTTSTSSPSRRSSRYLPFRSTPVILWSTKPLRELLAVVVTADGTHAVDVDRLDLLADDLTVEVASHDLDLRQLRHLPPRYGPPGRARRCSPRPATVPTRSVPPPARPPSSSGPPPRRTPRCGGTPRRRSAWSGRGPRGEPGSGAAGRTVGLRAPAAASCSPGRRVRSACSRIRGSSSGEHESGGGLEPAVEVHGGDDRLHRVGEDRRLGASARRVLALAEAQRRAEVELLRDLGERLRAHHRGAQLGQLALGQLRVLLVGEVGDDEAEHGVAEELEALVRLLDALLRAVRAVGERAVEEVVVDERPAQRELESCIECRVDGTAPPSGHHTAPLGVPSTQPVR